MRTSSPRDLILELLASACVAVNREKPWDIQVHHDHIYKRIVAGGSIALGENYVDGWWDCDALDPFFDRIFKLRLERSA